METDTCKRELVIEIPPDAVEREAETVTKQYARRVRIPGFRPGHAPTALVRRHFQGDIRSDVVSSLLPKFFEAAIKEQKWAVVGQPRFEDLKLEEGRPLTCKATFEIYPEFTLGEYKGLEVEEEPPTVGEEDVDRALDELRQSVATFEVVGDRPAAEGDYVVVNYRGTPRNKPEGKPVEAKDAVLQLGGQRTFGAFTSNLIGSKPGDVRQFEVAYPEDYPQKALVGTAFDFRVEVQSIKKKVIPPVDDDLAKSVSGFATLAELREKLRGDLQARRQREVEVEAKKKLVERLLGTHSTPVPEALVEGRLNRTLEATLAQLLAQGIDPRATEIDWRSVREESRQEAEKSVRASLVLEKIADAEKIEVSEEEVDEVLREMAGQRGETAVALKTRLTRDGGLDRIKSTRRTQKALDVVYRNAKIIRKTDSKPEPAEH